jgi:hypothetical protein
LKIKRASVLLIVESDWRATDPPLTSTISSNTCNQNFEIFIFFNVVESSGISDFEDDKHPKPLRARVVSYALGAYKVFYRKCFCGKFPKGLPQLEIERATALFNSRK